MIDMDGLVFKPDTGLPPVAVHNENPLGNKTGTWRSVRPTYQGKPAPCHMACPAGENISGCLNLVRQGRLLEAWALIREDNPLPAVCGRVCYHPCEEQCNRGQLDQPLNINAIERLVGDCGLNATPSASPATPSRGPVAVVGSGPAGLSCAYHLARRGYGVTIYEARSDIGGMLALGIPAYRLPKDILRAEIYSIQRWGVEIVRRTAIGPRFPLDRLLEEGNQAVFLAIGAHQPAMPQLPGGDLDGVTDALSFLRLVNEGRAPTVGKQVLVIGGGNVAIDAARCARRLGASAVNIFYRRSRAEMPAHPSEIAAAEEEGVRFDFLASPQRVLGVQRASGMEFLRNRLVEDDNGHRAKPVAIASSEFMVEADTIILATGQTPDSSYFAREGLATRADGAFVVNPSTLATNRPGIFAGGDAVTGPARVVDAIAAGKRAAMAIDSYIERRVNCCIEIKGLTAGAAADTEGPNTASAKEAPAENNQAAVRFDEINLDYFKPAPRVEAPRLATTERFKSDGNNSNASSLVDNFRETSATLSVEQARDEAARCFSCGQCNACDNCWLYCPELAISRVDGVYRIDYDYCKGCGLCVVECPRSAIVIEEEPR